jgi:4-amino-4-deoxy-L-arabinose transferase-like glycosyltransferase
VGFGVVGVVLTYLCGEALFGRKSGLVAALIVLSSWGYLLHARYAMPDMTLTALITLSMYSAIRMVHDSKQPQKWRIAFYVAMALATLTKGPPALLPILITAVFLLWTRQPQKLYELVSPMGWVLYSIIVAPWFVYIGVQHGSAWLSTAHTEVVARSVGQLGDAEPFWYFVPIVVGYFFPWSMQLPAMIWRYRWWQVGTPQAPHAGRLILCWFGVTLLVFSIVRGKNPQYILPVAIPLALLVGHTWVRFLFPLTEALPRSLRWSFYGVAGLNAILALALALFITRFYESLGSAWLYSYVALIGTCALCLWWCIGRHRYLAIGVTLAATVWLVWLMLLGHSLPLYDTAPGSQFARVLQPQLSAHDRVGSMRIEEKSLVFLLQRPVSSLRSASQAQAFLQAPGRAFVVMREADRQHLAEQSARPLYTLASVWRFRQMELVEILRAWREDTSIKETLVVVSNEKRS